MQEERRKLEFSVELAASPEEVWQVITTAAGITRWFAPEARVTAGLGGTIVLSWGPGMEGESPITVWEHGKRIAWTEGLNSPNARVVEFTLEAREGGTTTLRLVHSGFGAGASFDGEYDSTSGGWQSFLALLGFDLAEYKGTPGRHLARMQFTKGEQGALLAELLSAMQYERQGNEYTALLPDGTALRGRVLFEKAPGYLILTLDSLLGGALGLFCECCGANTALTTSWYLKGAATDKAEQLGAAWDTVLSRFRSK